MSQNKIIKITQYDKIKNYENIIEQVKTLIFYGTKTLNRDYIKTDRKLLQKTGYILCKPNIYRVNTAFIEKKKLYQQIFRKTKNYLFIAFATNPKPWKSLSAVKKTELRWLDNQFFTQNRTVILQSRSREWNRKDLAYPLSLHPYYLLIFRLCNFLQNLLHRKIQEKLK